MSLRIIWPGKTRDEDLRRLQEQYLDRIRGIGKCEIVEIREARGIDERYKERILGIEAEGIERQFKDDYIVCLFDRGKEMSSADLARFLERHSTGSSRPLAFVVGGFAGLAERILKRADFLLSLSRMTFPHELSRVLLLEQLYRSLTIIKGKRYAK